jgi:hypothetical protein
LIDQNAKPDLMIHPSARGAETEGGTVTTPDRFRGTGTLLIKGAEQSPVEYEITLFDIEQIMQAERWIEASAAVLEPEPGSAGSSRWLAELGLKAKP